LGSRWRFFRSKEEGSPLTTATSASGLQVNRREDSAVLAMVAVGIAGAVATGLTAWAVARSPILAAPGSVAIWRALIVALYVVVGLYTWWRRPDSRFGPLLVGNGFLYAATSFNASGAAAVYALGMVMWAVYVVYTAYVLLSFPRGRLESRLERGFIGAYALSTSVLTGLTLALSPTFPRAGGFADCGTRCPANPLAGADAQLGTALKTASSTVFTIALIGLTMLLFNKARASGPMARRAVTPVAAVFTVTVMWFVISLYVVPAYPGTESAARIVNGLLGVAIPTAILLGQVSGDLFAAIGLSQIAVRARSGPLTPAGVQKVLGDALDDRSLAVAVWDSDSSAYVDVHGAPLELPRASDRGIIAITDNGGSPVAAVIHDPALDADSDVVEGMVATSMMLLENTRLLEELRASRARIVETAERERRRIERDLHDGAQQRLMAIQIKLRLAQERAHEDDLAEQLEAISVDASAAVEELRTLAHGIYPSVLSTRGPADAIRSAVIRAPSSTRVVDDGIGRCSAATEAAIYFCSLEAIQNAVKHAGGDAHVTVTLGRDGRGVHFSIADDGVGIDTRAGDGVGLVSMRDRIGGVGGELEIISAPGLGTTVRGTVPDDGPSAVVKAGATR
jgi:signal transduction histidine kinase